MDNNTEQLIEQRYTYYITPNKCKTVQQNKGISRNPIVVDS